VAHFNFEAHITSYTSKDHYLILPRNKGTANAFVYFLWTFAPTPFLMLNEAHELNKLTWSNQKKN